MGHRVRMGIAEISRALAKTFNRGVGGQRAERALSLRLSSAASVNSLRSLRLKVVAVLLASLASLDGALAQDHTTVRHHKVENQDPAAAWLTEAESDIEKQDYATAEPLLKKYLDTYPGSYAAWYD